MSYKPGKSVIVTQDEVNRVGTILDRYVVSKRVVYDVLLENRSAMVMISVNGKDTYINKPLTAMLCDTDIVESNVPYKQLAAADELPICRTYSAGKASW